mgnify:CR=1 FL=1
MNAPRRNVLDGLIAAERDHAVQPSPAAAAQGWDRLRRALPGAALVPEFEGTTHYFWAVSRHFKIEDKELDDLMFKAVTHTFGEDIAMTEAQQLRMQRPSADPKHVTIKADAAPIAARKIVTRMLGSELAAAAE